jgi:hypothetical protein
MMSVGRDLGVDMRKINGRPIVAMALSASWLIAGCTIFGSAPTTTEVTLGAPGGDIVIECRSEPAIDGDGCLAWGERVRAASRADAADAVLIVLTDRQGVGRCIADFHDADGVLYASSDVACP